MEQGVWQEIELLYQKFQKLGISEAVDYDKYYLYSLITHSTAIEGSTLTELDTQLLFDEGVTAKGKPLVHHLMNEDLKQAYELAKVESDSLVPITPAFLKRMNAMLMRTTGSVHSVMGGSFDSSKGEFRLCGVTAGVGGHSYMNYLKVPAKVDELCAILQEKQKKMGTFREQYELSFNAHLNLVTIHPWVDGNGRTARLLMNYIQFCYHLFPTKIFKEDREEYILSLRQCQNEETNPGAGLPPLYRGAAGLRGSLLLASSRGQSGGHGARGLAVAALWAGRVGGLDPHHAGGASYRTLPQERARQAASDGARAAAGVALRQAHPAHCLSEPGAVWRQPGGGAGGKFCLSRQECSQADLCRGGAVGGAAPGPQPQPAGPPSRAGPHRP